MKKYEGKTVMLRPTGNNIRRGNGNVQEQCIKAKIIKVARVNVTFVKEGSKCEQKLRFKENFLSNDCNAGYIVYENEEELDNYFEASELSGKIEDFFRYRSSVGKVGITKLRKIAELLEIIPQK